MDFAFETTMANRSFAPWLRGLAAPGYVVHVIFFWLPSAEMAALRVRERVRSGGHDVPEADIRRRYVRGARNFVELYRPLATTWSVYDNSIPSGPDLVARYDAREAEEILDADKWKRVQDSWQRAGASPDGP